ncbi:MAG: GDCCVxC domain-containing (seleno)protein [Woeseiaceae bacterium]
MDKTSSPNTISQLTCPACGHISVETMPTNACVFFHPCAGCGVMLRPKPGDCCVFCSYGSVPCPPVQSGMACCDSG